MCVRSVSRYLDLESNADGKQVGKNNGTTLAALTVTNLKGRPKDQIRHACACRCGFVHREMDRCFFTK